MERSAVPKPRIPKIIKVLNRARRIYSPGASPSPEHASGSRAGWTPRCRAHTNAHAAPLPERFSVADLSSVGFSDLDLEALRIQLRKMNDQELRRFGLAARFMCSAGTKLRKTPCQGFLNQPVGKPA